MVRTCNAKLRFEDYKSYIGIISYEVYNHYEVILFMYSREKVLTIEDYEKLIAERPDDLNLKDDFAFHLMDQIIINYRTKKDIVKSILFKKLKSIVKEQPYLLSYIAFLEDNEELCIKNIIDFIRRYEGSEPFNHDQTIDLFLVFAPSFKGLYQVIGDEINKKWPDCSSAFFLWGSEALNFENNNDAALDFFSKSIEKDEKAWYSLLSIASIYHGQKIWKGAIQYYNKAFKSEYAQSAYDYFNLAWCYGKEKKYALEEDAYRKCLKMDENFAFALNNLAWSVEKQNRLDDALNLYSQSIKKGNDGNYPYRNKLRILKKLRRYEQAIEFINDCVQKKKLGKSYIKEIHELQTLLNSKDAIIDQPNDTEDKESINEEINEYIANNETKRPKDVSKRVPLSSERILEEEIEAKILKGELVFGKRLKMYDTDKGYGRQLILPGVGRIDLLAQDINGNDFYIIELKRGKSEDEVIGQTARYMSWVKQNLAKGTENIFGIICVNHVSEKLRLSAQAVPNISLFEYGVQTVEII
jgi:tetratricopeptide (TPR) repeat protein